MLRRRAYFRSSSACSIIAVFVFGSLTHHSSGQQIRSPVPSNNSSILNYAISLDDIYRAFKSDNIQTRAEAMLLIPEIVRTPYYHTQLIEALNDKDSEKIKFAIICLHDSTNLEDLARIESCVRAHPNDPELIKEASWIPELMLGKGPVSEDASELLQSLSDHQEEWQGKDYTDYWGAKLSQLLKLYAAPTGYPKYRESLAQALYGFMRTTDSAKAARIIMNYVPAADPKNPADRASLADLLWDLQLVVGPLDIPQSDADRENLEKLAKARKEAVAWWRTNKDKLPVYWFLDTLSRRGYETRNPADARATIKALISALKSNNRIESYAAGMVLRLALPDGDSLIVDRNLLMSPDDKTFQSEVSDAVHDYLTELLLCRANHWLFFQCADHEWNAEHGKYEVKKASALLPKS